MAGRVYTRRPPEERFWKLVKHGPDSTACSLWRGGTRNCYGHFSPGHGAKQYRAHVYAWILANGPPPADKPLILHRCDVPLCVNVRHLFAGTQSDNVRDMIAKGRGRVNRQHGENNHAALLTWDKVREIRKACGRGEMQRDIAARYGIDQSAVSKILSGESWKERNAE